MPDIYGATGIGDPDAKKRQQEAHAEHYKQLSAGSGGEGDDSGGDDDSGAVFNPDSARVAGGAPPVNFDSAQDILAGRGGGGGIIGPMNTGVQRQASNIAETTQGFVEQAQAGAPAQPYGAQQRGSLVSAMQPEHTDEEWDAAKGILGTQYTGQAYAESDVPGRLATAQGALEGYKAQGQRLETGVGVATEAQKAHPGLSRGEAKSEARRFLSQPEEKEAVRGTQRTIDKTFRDIYSGEERAMAAETAGRERAQEYRTRSRGFVTGFTGQMHDRAQAESDEINKQVESADRAYASFADHGDIDRLQRETPEGYLSPDVQKMIDDPTRVTLKAAEHAMMEIKDSPRFNTIRDVPLTREFITSGKPTLGQALDPAWLEGVAPDKFPTLVDSGRIRQYINSPGGARNSWNPDRMTQPQTNTYGEQGGRSSQSLSEFREQQWAGISDEEKTQIRELQKVHDLAMQRQAELTPLFGTGGEFEAYLPTSIGAAAIGKFEPADYANYMYSELSKTNWAEVMDPGDREVYNNGLALIDEMGKQISITGDKKTGGEIAARATDYLHDNSELIRARMSVLGFADDAWDGMLRKMKKAYKKYKKKKFWKTIMSVVGFGLAIFAAPLIMGAVGALGTSLGAIGARMATAVALDSLMIGSAIQLVDALGMNWSPKAGRPVTYAGVLTDEQREAGQTATVSY